MEAKTKKQMKLTSAQIIPLGFLGVIAVGTLLLLLPLRRSLMKKILLSVFIRQARYLHTVMIVIIRFM